MARTELPEIIYHYTSMTNTLNILQSGELWASDLRYCNDATETRYGRDLVLDRVAQLAGQIRRDRVPQPMGATPETYDTGDEPEFFAAIFDEIVAGQRNLSSDNWSMAYGVAFATQGDQLSQWRGYAPGGCAIGVDPSQLVRRFPAFGLESEFRVVGYGPAGIEDVYQAIVTAVAPPGRTSMSFDPDPYHPLRSRNKASRALLSIKDVGFAEEEEVRLLLSLPGHYHGEGTDIDADEGVEGWRVSSAGLFVPFFTVPINREAIKEIWVGPGVHRDRNVTALRRYLAAGNALGVQAEIRPSAIPFQ